MKDYINSYGEWSPAELGLAVPFNLDLGDIVTKIKATTLTLPEPKILPALAKLKLKIAIIGSPFSGKTSLVASLTNKYDLVHLSSEEIVKNAVCSFESALDALKEQSKVAKEELSDAPTEKQPPIAEAGETEQSVTEEVADDGVEMTEADLDVNALSPVEKLGMLAKAALSAGKAVPTSIMVGLIAESIANICAKKEPELAMTPKPPQGEVPPPKGPKSKKTQAIVEDAKATAPKEQKVPLGLILEGFPNTQEQAVELEKMLTGTDLEAKEKLKNTTSLIAPPRICVQEEEVKLSSLDAVLSLTVPSEEVALKRAYGRRIDPQTGRVYHIEFDPPQNDKLGIMERLQEKEEDTEEEGQALARLQANGVTHQALNEWFARFRTLRTLDTDKPITEVHEEANLIIQAVLDSKTKAMEAVQTAKVAKEAKQNASKASEAAETSKVLAEKAAKELFLIKKAELEAKGMMAGKQAEAEAATELHGISAEEAATKLNEVEEASKLACEEADKAAAAAKSAQEAADKVLEYSTADLSVYEARLKMDSAVKETTSASEAANQSLMAASEAKVAALEALKTAQEAYDQTEDEEEIAQNGSEKSDEEETRGEKTNGIET